MHSRTRGAGVTAAGAAVVVALIAGVALSADGEEAGVPALASAAAAGGVPGQADLDHDGYDDLAVGAPEAAVGGDAKAGYVSAVFGSRRGVDVGRHRQVTQSSPGVPGTPEPGDRFGSAVAVGDLDGDGYADLVVGAAGEAIGDVRGAGSVTVVFGSSDGVSGHAIAFHAPEPTARRGFGDALALGDFDGDGRTDLAVADGLHIDVVRGATDLPSRQTPEITRLDPPGGGAATGHIAAGDVNGDGYTDLVTVAASDDPADEGTLAVLPGSARGLRSAALGDEIGLPFMGYTPVVGDVDGDGSTDLAVGAPGADGRMGAVSVLYPDGGDLVGKGSVFFGPRSLDHSTARAAFGAALGGPAGP